MGFCRNCHWLGIVITIFVFMSQSTCPTWAKPPHLVQNLFTALLLGDSLCKFSLVHPQIEPFSMSMLQLALVHLNYPYPPVILDITHQLCIVIVSCPILPNCLHVISECMCFVCWHIEFLLGVLHLCWFHIGWFLLLSLWMPIFHPHHCFLLASSSLLRW